AKLVAGCGMSLDFHAERTQLLDEPPDFRAAGSDLVANLGAADHDRGVVHQYANDAAETDIGPLRRYGGACLAGASWGRFGDAGIITSRGLLPAGCHAVHLTQDLLGHDAQAHIPRRRGVRERPDGNEVPSRISIRANVLKRDSARTLHRNSPFQPRTVLH